MKSLFSLSLLLIALISYSQQPTVEWVRTWNGEGATFDELNMVEVDPVGDIVAAGRGYQGGNYVDLIVLKYNSDGDLLWDYSWDGPAGNEEYPFDMEIGSNGNIYIVGYTKTGDAYYETDFFIVALDSDGEYLWEDVYGLPGGADQAFEVRINSTNEIIVGGYGYNASSTIQSEGLLRKYNFAGDELFTVLFNASTEWGWADAFRAIDLDPSGNIIAAGAATIASTWYDFATVRYTASGDQDWLVTDPGGLNDVSETVNDVITDSNGNVYILGQNSTDEHEVIKYNSDGALQWNYVHEDLSFNQSEGVTFMAMDNAQQVVFGVTAAGNMIITKLSVDGDEMWQYTYDAPLGGNDDIFELIKDAQDNIYVTGRSGYTNGYYDVLTFKLDTNGNEEWLINFDGPTSNTDEGRSLAIANDGSLYVAGWGSGFTAYGDALLIKYNQGPVAVSNSENVQFSMWPNPAREQTTIGLPAGFYDIAINDILGQTVIRAQNVSGNYEFYTSNLSAGTYTVLVSNKISVFSRKLVLE